MKVKHIYEPILQTDVIFLTECTPDQVRKYLKQNKNLIAEGYDTCAGSVTFLDEIDKKGRKTREYLIVVEDKKDFYTLLHETVHLTTHILGDHLIPVGLENSEVFAYYQTFWFKNLWRFMNNIEVTLRRKKGGK